MKVQQKIRANVFFTLMTRTVHRAYLYVVHCTMQYTRIQWYFELLLHIVLEIYCPWSGDWNTFWPVVWKTCKCANELSAGKRYKHISLASLHTLNFDWILLFTFLLATIGIQPSESLFGRKCAERRAILKSWSPFLCLLYFLMLEWAVCFAG